MLKCKELAEIFKKNNINFFSGVPDSTFKGWINFIDENPEFKNIISVNECEATAVCSGYYLASGKIGVVYMQNSGLGKCVNPLTSLCDKEVYSIPMVLMIGLRGEPGKKDEPQHRKMGRITLSILDCLEIPYKTLPEDIKEAEETISEIKKIAELNKTPVAIIIKSEIIEDYSIKQTKNDFEMSREDAIKIIVDNIEESDLVVSTTGKTSRELFEYRINKNQIPEDFYTVGSMGCSNSIANAIALNKPHKNIFVLDGDGAVLMQMGSLATIGHYKPKNFYHIILDNNSYDSTGGQKTVSDNVNFEKVALSCGYNFAKTIEKKQDLTDKIKTIKKLDGPVAIIVKVNNESRKDLGRPTKTPIENKENFMNKIAK